MMCYVWDGVTRRAGMHSSKHNNFQLLLLVIKFRPIFSSIQNE